MVPEQCFVLHVWGPNCSQRSSSKEGSQTSESDAPQMLWPHSRRACWSLWLARRFDVQRDCLVRDIFDEKEIKDSDPGPLTEVEAGLAQDVTLESELWTFDEVEWHETAQDTTTIKYVPVQVRPAVAKLRERVVKAATEETGSQQVRAWKLFLSLDKMLFHTSDAKRTNNTSLTKAIRTRISQIEAGNALEILRQSQQTYVPQRTTKPRTDPTAATDKHNQRRFNLSSQL